jgi:hypothetical protein
MIGGRTAVAASELLADVGDATATVDAAALAVADSAGSAGVTAVDGADGVGEAGADVGTPDGAAAAGPFGTLITTVTGDGAGHEAAAVEVFAGGVAAGGVLDAGGVAGGGVAAGGVVDGGTFDVPDALDASTEHAAASAAVAVSPVAGPPALPREPPSVPPEPASPPAALGPHAGSGYGNCVGANSLLKMPSGSGGWYGASPHGRRGPSPVGTVGYSRSFVPKKSNRPIGFSSHALTPPASCGRS